MSDNAWPTCVRRYDPEPCYHQRTWPDRVAMLEACDQHDDWVDALGYATCACHQPDGFPCDESLAPATDAAS